MDNNEEKLEVALSAIEKQFGKGSVWYNVDRSKLPEVEKISSGSILIDKALGGGFLPGGFPRGRIVEIYGGESVGKTTLALHLIAEAQKLGFHCAFVDAEHALYVEYATALGVDFSKLVLSQPSSGEEALQICDMLIRSGTMGVVVVDSVAALVGQAELEGDIGDSHVGIQARLMGQAMRKLNGVVANTKTILTFINQTRMKVQTYGHGDPTTTSGGNALKFYATQRVEMKRIGSVKSGDEVIGNEIQVKVVKNKIAPPFKVANVVVTFGVGVNKYQEVIGLAVEKGIINKGGAWYSYKETRIQGQNKMEEALRDNPDLFNQIRQEVIVAIT